MKTPNKTYHTSVLPVEAIKHLNIRPGKTYVDATFGGGGHTRAILEADPTCTVIALDWDKIAIETNAPALEEEFGNRFKIIWGNFNQVYKILKKNKIFQVDGCLADFGTSMFQIKSKAGMSFQTDTPLDMRMSTAHHFRTAADILNRATIKELVYIFSEYGEEPKSKRIAFAITEERKKAPFKTTGQLVKLIESIINPKAFKAKRGIHPATKVFQALRIAVNQELDNIKKFLSGAVQMLKPNGRLVCISFHSLEDRLVKNFLRDNTDKLETLTPKPITPSPEEIERNPSSRSAKLRAGQKY